MNFTAKTFLVIVADIVAAIPLVWFVYLNARRQAFPHALDDRHLSLIQFALVFPAAMGLIWLIVRLGRKRNSLPWPFNYLLVKTPKGYVIRLMLVIIGAVIGSLITKGIVVLIKGS